METPTPEQIARLPKWAQDHLRRLTRQRDDALEVMRGSARTTDDYRAPGLHLGHGIGDHELISLDDVSAMRLVLEDGQEYTIQPWGPAVTVLHTDRVGRVLTVQPRAANSVVLTAQEAVQ